MSKLKRYHKTIKSLPNFTVLKSELLTAHNQLVNLIKEARLPNANREYFKFKVQQLYRYIEMGMKQYD